MTGLYLLPVVAAALTVILSIRLVKTVYLKQMIILYSLVNLPVVFFLESDRKLYLAGYITTVLLLTSIRKFINRTYSTDSYLGIEGIVLASPRLSLVVRMSLLMAANFPPFINFGVVYNHLINTGLSATSIYIILTLLFNFILFSKLTSKLLFGRPNSNIVYTDLNLKDSIVMGVLSLFNLIYGIYYLLNL